MISFLKNLFARSSDPQDWDILHRPAKMKAGREAGKVRGKHFTEYIETVKILKREGEFEQAERLLLELIAATERESEIQGGGPAPAYYEDLAIVYRKLKRLDDEVTILERYMSKMESPRHAHPKIIERLPKARELRDKHAAKE